jgi:hypothetical protein
MPRGGLTVLRPRWRNGLNTLFENAGLLAAKS